MRRFVILFGVLLVVLLSTLTLLFADFIRAQAWHTRNGDSVSIGSHRITIPHNWEPAGPPNDLALPTADGTVMVRAARMPWNKRDSLLRFEPLRDEIVSDALARDVVEAWINGDEGRGDLATSEVVTIKGRSTFCCARRAYRNHTVGFFCLARGFAYDISSIASSKYEAQVRALIASIE